MENIKKGTIYYADLTPTRGSEQGGVRPVLVLQNNIGNKYSSTIIICVVTSKTNKANNIPTHVFLGQGFGLMHESVALLEQIRTIDKCRIIKKIGEINEENLIQMIDKAIHISFDLN
ncbi:MAG: type II toxin-antitoxin system PemK/MazF family toxin [Candidatus Pacebacteria bacterium]|nr:type II toxin-antitoxin system PemK/MazF family toxin [Candidatus Paceibacterota bacterium]